MSHGRSADLHPDALALTGEKRPPQGTIPSANDPLGALARAAGAGDGAAAQELARAVAPGIYRVVRALLGSSHPDLDDQVQDALIGFMTAVPAFRAECSVGQFAARIAARRTIAAKRRERVVRSWLGFHVRTEQPLQTLPETPSDAAVASRRKDLVRSLLMALPEAQAESAALHIVLGYSIEEVAQMTSTPLNTVRSRLRLAKEAMRARLHADAGLMALAEREEEGE